MHEENAWWFLRMYSNRFVLNQKLCNKVVAL